MLIKRRVYYPSIKLFVYVLQICPHFIATILLHGHFHNLEKYDLIDLSNAMVVSCAFKVHDVEADQEEQFNRNKGNNS